MPLTRLNQGIEDADNVLLLRKPGPSLKRAAKVVRERAPIAIAFATTLNTLHDAYHQRLTTSQAIVQIPSRRPPFPESCLWICSPG